MGDSSRKVVLFFLDPDDSLSPHPDQWELLDRVERVSEARLDDIIEINQLRSPIVNYLASPNGQKRNSSAFGLPPCAQKMLIDGVKSFQRVSCFRLAVHLKRIGFPFDITVAALKVWSLKNKPIRGKKVITEEEIIDQIKNVYRKNYLGYGCNSIALTPFCDSRCPITRKTNKKQNGK